jgi:predicted ATPase/class 3 adenylate cyclase
MNPGQPALPTGTVTFLRTDVEGSMGLARVLGADWDSVNAAHLGIIRRVVDAHGGICVRTEGDAFFGVFPEAGAAVAAAIQAQRALAAHVWPEGAAVRVRMGLHSGEAHLAGDDYGGFDVNRAARIAAAGHGGQIVLSEPTRLLAEAALLDGVTVRDLGRHVLRDVPAPEHLFQLDVPGLRTAFPPLRTSRPTEGNLPPRVTSFLGRDAEIDELRSLLAANRLVTLTGPGGIGKTSLAVELARTVAPSVPDGAWFVALDEIQDPALVLPVIARTLGLFDGPERPAVEGLTRHLENRTILLVLDNFEHLLPAAGDVGPILRASPGVLIVVTSRAPLRITGEQEYPLRPLAVGTEACSMLFTQRARAVRPGWEPGPDAIVMDEVCGLLDGLPLGLELAAARVSLLPLRAIRDRLAARMPLPGSAPRDAPDRQRTLEGAIAWSHDLLRPDQQRLLHELAVFEGSFDLEQAVAVCGDGALDGIATLVEQSLITREPDDPAGGVRFRLLQTIRSFALGRLADDGRETRIRRGHADAYLALALRAAPHLPGAEQPAWLDRLALDHANLRAATQWAIEAGETELALQLVAAQWRYWQLDGHLNLGRDLTNAALAMPGAEAPTAGRLAAIAAAGGIAYWRSESALADQLYRRQLALAEQLGDDRAAADASFNLIFTRYIGGDIEGALATIAESERRYRLLGDERGLARIEWTRGTVAMQSGDLPGAIAIMERSLARFEANGDAWYHATAAGSLGWAYWSAGNKPVAHQWLLTALAETLAMRDIASITIGLPMLAVLALDNRGAEAAASLMGAFEEFRQLYGIEPPAGLNFLIETNAPLQRTRATIGDEAFEAAFDRGRRMSLDEAVALVAAVAEASPSRAMSDRRAAGSQ